MKKEIDPKILAKITSGELYDSNMPELMALQEEYKMPIYEYNTTFGDPKGMKRRKEILKELFPENGDTAFIEAPFHANWGCTRMKIGKNFYANFNLVLNDDGPITIGDNVMIGPNVTLVTACHPLHPTIRKGGIQFNEYINIGNSCWIGAGVIIMPSVTIGNNCVIGAGSIVTKDIPDNSLAYGSPAKVVRKIGEEDLLTYRHGKKIPADFQPK
ncbi:MAG: sugar O-acetyltransferase [Bacilli bacterium]|nr:sugar O-acetyltransferase [Bacilli bacterium]